MPENPGTDDEPQSLDDLPQDEPVPAEAMSEEYKGGADSEQMFVGEEMAELLEGEFAPEQQVDLPLEDRPEYEDRLDLSDDQS